MDLRSRQSCQMRVSAAKGDNKLTGAALQNSAVVPQKLYRAPFRIESLYAVLCAYP
jgi:hypothetical protein